jgi:K+/H+ antiporter YhaU regulatory subunit KhtT
MPIVSFSLNDTLYRVLEEVGKRRGVSPHIVAKEIIINIMLNLMQDIDASYKYQTSISDIDVEHQYQKSISDINIRHKYQTSISDIDDRHKYQDIDVQPSDPEGKDVNVDELIQKITDVLEKKLFKKIQDELNAYTSKVEQVLQKQAELVERFEALEERVKKLEGGVTQKKEVRRGGWDKCEILRKELIIFESSIAHKIKNRDSFFASLERDCGAEVIEAKDQRVAVDPNFWSEFKEKLNTLNTNNESIIKKTLGVKGHTLLKTLWESGLIYYDSVNKRWVLSEPEESKEGSEELKDLDYV